MQRTHILTALTIAFYALSLASLGSYLWLRDEHPQLFVYLGLSAIALRIVYYALRFLAPKK